MPAADLCSPKSSIWMATTHPYKKEAAAFGGHLPLWNPSWIGVWWPARLRVGLPKSAMGTVGQTSKRLRIVTPDF